MKKDKLKIDSFADKSGKNYRQANKLNKNLIKNFIGEELKYDVLKIDQIWRHIHAKIKKDNKTFFFKMSSTKEIGERTYNETEWNKQINKIVRQEKIDFFKTPEIVKTGYFEENFYYVAEFFPGGLLATDNPPNTKELNKWIDKIVDINIFLLKLQKFNLPKDRENINFKDKKDRYTKLILGLFNQVQEHKLDEVLERARGIEETYQPAINHADFVPWHMIINNKQIILIDGEMGSSNSPKYYDVIYFYHRLYTAGQNPVLAKQYLAKIRNRIFKKSKSEFDKSIIPILALRIIGGYWDEKTTGKGDFNFHNRLKKDFLKNKLY